MLQAIRITKNHLDVITAETGIKKESMATLAISGDTYIVVGPEIAHGWQTYHSSIFRDMFEYVSHIDPRKFNEVIFK